MNWALTADGMTYAPKHRSSRPVDECSMTDTRLCGRCTGYPGRRRAVA